METPVNHSKSVSQGPLPPTDPPELVEPPLVDFYRFLYRLFRRNDRVDRFLTPLLKHREHLPIVQAEELIPGFSDSIVQIRDVPRGLWATPLVDTLTVVKAVQGFRSRRVLEIGSYRGATARLIAESTGDATHIWAVDCVPEHGQAYLGTPLEQRIHRVTGKASVELLEPYGKFDLIFVDADHDYSSAYRDTVCALKLLAPGGVILWHDYHNKAYLHGYCGVSEALAAIKRSINLPIASVGGTMIAIYSEHPGWETSRTRSDIPVIADPWKSDLIRGD